MNELKPCPFCGNEDIYIWQVKSVSGSKLYEPRCLERSCKASLWAFPSEKEAIEAWNKRVRII